MRYWTALQEPFSQAALVENGRIVRRIPDSPPRTRARQVKCVAEFDGNLVVGRLASIELWTPDGGEMISSLYHPYIVGLHEIHQYKDMLLVACAGIDVLFLMTQDCECVWSWWAHHGGYCPRIPEVDGPDWEMFQSTGKAWTLTKDESHLNSARVHGDQVLASLLRKDLIVQIPLFGTTATEVCNTAFGVHSPIMTSGGLVYGSDKGVCLPGHTVLGYEWVKRIYEMPDGPLLITHEAGVTKISTSGDVLTHHTLPRPFGVALLEM